MSYVPSLKKIYVEQVIAELKKSRGYKNPHQVPKLTKVVLNTGIDSEADKNQIADIQRDMSAIAGQKAVLTKSRKAIASFKLRAGQVVGCTRSEEHTSELQSHSFISYAVFCLNK